MVDYFSYSQSYMDSFGASIGRTFDALKEGYELLNTSIQLPLDLIAILPSVFGAAISVVLFTMIVKFVLGR